MKEGLVTTKEISIAYFKAHLAQVADEIERGESFVVTRYNRPALRVVRYSGDDAAVGGFAPADGPAPAFDMPAATAYWRSAAGEAFDSIEAIIGRALTEEEAYALSMVCQREGLPQGPETLESLRDAMSAHVQGNGRAIKAIGAETDGLTTLSAALIDIARVPGSAWSRVAHPAASDPATCPACGRGIDDRVREDWDPASPDKMARMACPYCGEALSIYGKTEDGWVVGIDPERMPLSRLAEFGSADGDADAIGG